MKYQLRYASVLFILILFVVWTGPSGAAMSPLAKALRSIDNRVYYKALNILENYRPEPDELPLYYYIKGRALSGMKRYSEAIEFLNRAFITSKDEELKKVALFERGRAYLKGGFYYEAASNFKLYIRIYPKAENIQKAYIYYAQALLMSGRYQEALRYFKAIKLKRPEVVFGKAEVFHRIGLYRTASGLFKKGIKDYPRYIQSHPDVMLSYAENLFKIGKFEKAKPFYYLLTETPLKEKAYIGLGEIALREGDLDSALMHFKRAQNSADRVIKRKALLNIGLIMIKKGMTKEAINNFLILRENYPYTPEAKRALLELSRLYRKKGDFLKAEKYLKEIIFGNSPSDEALRELELLVLDTIRKDRKSFLKTWQECGRFLMTIKRQKTLLKVARALIDEGGDFLKVYNFLIRNGNKSIRESSICELALFYGRLGNIKKLLSLYKKLGPVKKSNDEIKRVKAYIFALEGKPERALALLKKINKAAEADYELLIMIAMQVSPEQFSPLYLRVSGALNKKIDYQLIGDLYYRKGMFSEALKYYRLAMKLGNVKPHVLFRVALLNNARKIKLTLSKQSNVYGKFIKENFHEEELKKSLMEL